MFVYGKAAVCVVEGVLVEAGCLGLPGKFAELLSEYLLGGNVEVLIAEEDNAALGDWRKSVVMS